MCYSQRLNRFVPIATTSARITREAYAALNDANRAKYNATTFVRSVRKSIVTIKVETDVKVHLSLSKAAKLIRELKAPHDIHYIRIDSNLGGSSSIYLLKHESMHNVPMEMLNAPNPRLNQQHTYLMRKKYIINELIKFDTQTVRRFY